jgi:16S rRNA (cytosine967-C5)-methyltransferase
MHASCVRVEAGDAASVRNDGPFDRVLVDPPCSGLGTLQSRPDISVCTISRRESEEVIERLLGERPDFDLEESVELVPHRDRTDGFYVARLRRRSR